MNKAFTVGVEIKNFANMNKDFELWLFENINFCKNGCYICVCMYAHDALKEPRVSTCNIKAILKSSQVLLAFL